MANADYVAKLKRSVESWNWWRKDNSQVRPDLTVADLSGVGLMLADLTVAKLRGAKLSGASLRVANLRVT